MPKLLTLDEAALELRVKRTKLYDLMKQEGLPYIASIAKERLILDEDLWQWVRLRSVIDSDETCDESRDE